MFEIEPALLDADLLIGAFEHREIEIVLLADVIIQHALVGAGLGRDPVDARAGETMGGKFLLRGLENAKPHALGIALPFQNSFCLGQNRKTRRSVTRRRTSKETRTPAIACSTRGAV